jgi:hypothetical protein
MPSFIPKISLKTQEITQKYKQYFLTAWGIFIGIALSSYNLASISLFLGEFSPVMLPLSTGLAGIIGLIGLGIYARQQLYMPFISLANAGLWATVIWLIVLLIGLAGRLPQNMGGNTWIFLAMAMLPLYNTFLRLIFWSSTEKVLGFSPYKQERNPANIGLLLGESLVYVVSLGATHINLADYLFLVSVIALTSAIFVVNSLNTITPSLRAVGFEATYIRANNSWGNIFKQKYLVLLGILAGLVAFLGIYIDYFFLSALDAGYKGTTAQKKIYFLAMFGVIGSGIGFLLRLYLSRFIIRQYGLRLGMLIMPLGLTFTVLVVVVMASILGGDLSLASMVAFMLLVASKMLYDLGRESFYVPIFRLYLLPINERLRGDIQLKLEGGIYYVGVMLGGFSIFFLGKYLPSNIAGQLLGVLLVLGALIYMIFKTNAEYKNSLQGSLSKNEEKTTQKKPLLGADTQKKSIFLPLSEKIYQKIDKNPQQLSENGTIWHLNMLKILNPITYKKVILRLLDNPEEKIQPFLRDLEKDINMLIESIDKKAYNIISANEHPQFALSFYKKTRYHLAESRKESLILDEKILNWISYIDEKLRLLSLQGEMYGLSVQDKLDHEDEILRNVIDEFAKEIVGKIAELAKNANKDVQKISLQINENIQKIALQEAQHWCILEAIPVLYVLINSKYFSVFKHSDIIQKTYNVLKGAEYRLERLKYLEQLTLSKLENERTFGALLTAYAKSDIKIRLLNQLLQDSKNSVRYYATVASAKTLNVDLYNNLIEKLGSLQYGNASFASMVETSEEIFEHLELAFYIAGQKEIVQKRIAQIYGYVGTSKAMELLLKKVTYSNQTVALFCLEMLSKCGYHIEDTDSIKAINEELSNTCEALTWNMSILMDLKRQNASQTIIKAMESELETDYDKIFSLMALIYDSNSVNLVKENIRSGDPDRADFAIELLEIFVSETSKMMLKTLLNSSSMSQKIETMQDFFPTDPMPLEKAFFAIIQKDYKWLNIWTKSCALYELSQISDYNDQTIFLANVVNPNTMISELSAKTLYKKDNAVFEEKLNRINNRKNYQKSVESALKVQQDEDLAEFSLPTLKFEIAKFLQEIPEFSNIEGLTLAKIANNAELIRGTTGEILANYENYDKLDYFVIYQGNILIQNEDETFSKKYTEKMLICRLEFLGKERQIISLIAKTDFVVYKFNAEILHQIMSLEENIPEAILEIRN